MNPYAKFTARVVTVGACGTYLKLRSGAVPPLLRAVIGAIATDGLGARRRGEEHEEREREDEHGKEASHAG